MRFGLAVLLVLLGFVEARSAGGGLEVRAREGWVTIRAQEVPLSQILDRLAQETGMKVVYEASRPSHLVTTRLEGLPQRDALLKVLEGLGVDYLFRLDPSGRRVEMLIIGGGAGRVSSTSSGLGRPAPTAPGDPTGEVPDEFGYEVPPEAPPAGHVPPPPEPPPGIRPGPPRFPQPASLPFSR